MSKLRPISYISRIFLEPYYVSGEVLDARDKPVSENIYSPFPQGACSRVGMRETLNNHVYEYLTQAELCEEGLGIPRTYFRSKT